MTKIDAAFRELFPISAAISPPDSVQCNFTLVLSPSPGPVDQDGQ